jgi:hypothetical protein
MQIADAEYCCQKIREPRLSSVGRRITHSRNEAGSYFETDFEGQFSEPESSKGSEDGKLDSSDSSSSNAGSETTYRSAAQLPRSSSLHRSPQKGKSGLFSDSVDFLQIGHLNFICLVRKRRVLSLPDVELSQDAKRRSCRDA